MISCEVEISFYGCVSIRAAWLDRRPRFSSERAADVSSAQTKSTNGGSQGVRMLTKCRRISLECTKSPLLLMAWEVRVSAAPDFRLHYYIGLGSLTFCQLGQPKCQRTDPSKKSFQTSLYGYRSLDCANRRLEGIFYGFVRSNIGYPS